MRVSVVPGLAAVRDKLIAEGERVLLQLLTPVAHGAELEAAMRMLSGSVLQSALLHGYLPSDDVIAATVDLLLRGLDARDSTCGPGTAPMPLEGATHRPHSFHQAERAVVPVSRPLC